MTKSLIMFQLPNPLYAADHEKRSANSAPLSPESAGRPYAKPPESVSPSSIADPSPVLPLRRSNRRIKAHFEHFLEYLSSNCCNQFCFFLKKRGTL